MKSTLQKIGIALTATVAVILLWELVRPNIVALIPDNTVVVVREEPQPTTVEGIIEAEALNWLKGPEAFAIAKERVTESLIKDLSKL